MFVLSFVLKLDSEGVILCMMNTFFHVVFRTTMWMFSVKIVPNWDRFYSKSWIESKHCLCLGFCCFVFLFFMCAHFKRLISQQKKSLGTSLAFHPHWLVNLVHIYHIESVHGHIYVQVKRQDITADKAHDCSWWLDRPHTCSQVIPATTAAETQVRCVTRPDIAC